MVSAMIDTQLLRLDLQLQRYVDVSESDEMAALALLGA